MDMRKIGEMCKSARVEHGYTLVEAGTQMGYDFSTVWGFENGRNDNYIILLWYVTKCGVDPVDVVREGGISYDGSTGI